jgi:hypothetical protein
MVFAWTNAVDVDRFVFVDANGPTPEIWTVVGRFLISDLLGGFTPERRHRLLDTVDKMVREATVLASRWSQVEQ